MKTVDILKEYTNYSDKTQSYMKRLLKSIEDEKHCIDDAYELSINLIAANVELVIVALEDIKKNGMVITDNQGRLIKNHSIQVFNSAQGYLVKLLTHFGATKASRAKISKSEVEETDIDDFIENLTV